MRTIIFSIIFALLFILYLFLNARYRDNRFTKSIVDTATVFAFLLVVLEFFGFGPRYWIGLPATSSSGAEPSMTAPESNPAPATIPPVAFPRSSFGPSGDTSSPPPPNDTSSPPPPAGTPGKLLYQHSLNHIEDSPDWNVATYDYGAAGYDGQGYYVLSRTGGRSHVIVNQSNMLKSFTLEVLATPLSQESEAAILIVFDADYLGGGGYYYILSPSGTCGLGMVVGNDIDVLDSDSICPSLKTGQSYRIRIKVVAARLIATVNEQMIKEYVLPSYSEGYIGLGVYNFAPQDSPTEATVRFNDLTVWSLDD